MGKGFNPFDGKLTVTFEDTRYAGGEIQLLLDVPMGDFLQYMDLDTVEKRLDWMIERGVITGWNFEEEGKALEVTDDNIRRLPFPLVRKLVGVYATAALSPSDPFEKPSPAGEQSAAPSDETAEGSNRRRNTRRS